ARWSASGSICCCRTPMPRGAEALRRLEFHVQSELYLTPTAAHADIVLPVASAWEREGLRVGFGLDLDACELVQLRPAMVTPRAEARAYLDIVFDLASVSASVDISGMAISGRRSIINWRRAASAWRHCGPTHAGSACRSNAPTKNTVTLALPRP